METHSASGNERESLRNFLGTTVRTLTSMGLATVMIVVFTATSATASTSSADGAASSTSDDSRDADPQQPEFEMEDAEMILVMDASGSMRVEDAGGQTRIAAARDALNNVVDSLEDHQRVGMRVFAGEITDADASEACQDSELAVEIGTDNHDDLRDAIDNYDAVGARTPLAFALEQGAGDLSDEGNRTIVLVSDGEENCVPDPCEMAAEIADQGIDLAIHTVGFNLTGDEADTAREQLQCIADAGNGEYFDAEDAETLTHTLERLSQRAFQPFALQGEEIEPGTNQDNAPILQPDQQYVGTFDADNLYYRVERQHPNSSIHVGMATYDPDNERDTGASLRLSTLDGETCSTDFVGSVHTDGRNVFRDAQVTAYPMEDPYPGQEECATDDELLIRVSSDRYSDASRETIQSKPFELVITEEPDPENRSSLYGREELDVTWQDMPRDRDAENPLYPGTSFNAAPLLEPGETYDLDLVPGEAHIYRIEADWNESIQAEAFFPEPSDALSERLRDHRTHVFIQVFSPNRGAVSSTGNVSEYNPRGFLSHSDATTRTAISWPVQWGQRQEHRAFGDMRAQGGHSASVAGEYYVAVWASPAEENVSFTMPYRLTADTFEVLDGETPQYPDTSAEEDNPARGTETEEPDDGAEDDAAYPAEQSPNGEEDAVAGESFEPADDVTSGDDEPVSAEQTGLFSGSTAALLGLAAAGLLFIAAGAIMLVRIFRSSSKDQA